MKAQQAHKDYHEKLMSGILPVSLDKLSKKLELESKNFKNYEDYENKTVETLEEELATNTQILEKEWKTRSDIGSYTKEIEAKKTALNLLTKSKINGKSKVSELETESRITTQTIMNMNNEITQKRDILDKTAEYEEYQNALNEITELETNYDEIYSKLKDIEKRLEGSYGLEKTGKEAEILAIENTIKNINLHAESYINQLFENPITVRLENVKDDGKSLKLKMNTSIEYNGEKYAHVDELSGGERQRLDLAFLLAVNDMLGSNILMLDEVFNNIDMDIHSDILNSLKSMCENKMILVVSHEAIRGLFDHEIEIGHKTS